MTYFIIFSISILQLFHKILISSNVFYHLWLMKILIYSKINLKSFHLLSLGYSILILMEMMYKLWMYTEDTIHLVLLFIKVNQYKTLFSLYFYFLSLWKQTGTKTYLSLTNVYQLKSLIYLRSAFEIFVFYVAEILAYFYQWTFKYFFKYGIRSLNKRQK